MKLKVAVGLLLLCVCAVPALADSYAVSVGYADGLRGVGFFPSPWYGDAGVVFVGNKPADGAPDAGAVMINNLTGGSITVDDVTVLIPTFACGGGCNYYNVFDLWGSNVLAAGQKLIITQTTFYNFDTSDYSGTSCGVNNGLDPVINVKVDGVTTSFTDSGQVLNTSGYDFACTGANESFAWRPVGTFGGPAGTPEPASLVLFGTGLLGIGSRTWKRFIG